MKGVESLKHCAMLSVRAWKRGPIDTGHKDDDDDHTETDEKNTPRQTTQAHTPDRYPTPKSAARASAYSDCGAVYDKRSLDL
ncbi:hypothetical protein PTKU46_80280 [Paraburkholderia terrae]